MYEKFYNLKREPFHITPDPRFLYLSDSHKQALASIIYGIDRKKGFVMITGGVGVGKTTIVRTYLERATAVGLKVIYVFHAQMSFKDLVKTIYRELGLELTTDDLIGMVTGLHVALIKFYRQGTTVALIIDEAQNMPLETLENLRMLSNLETPTQKLIQVVLVGQTELEDLLERYGLRQLKQRIAVHSQIMPLNRVESYLYIAHRLSVAGLDRTTIFSKGALEIIIQAAYGVPRRLNILCDNALITGFAYQRNPVTASIAREVVADFGRRKEREAHAHRPHWQAAAVVVLVALALLIALLLSSYGPNLVHPLADGGSGQVAKPQPQRAPVTHMLPD